MRKTVAALLLAAGATPTATGHPATELYIPLGQSPGVSGARSWVGTIEARAATQRGFTMKVQDDERYVSFDASTRVYLQYLSPRKRNQLGDYADCESGLRAEVYVGADGKARWVKLQMR